MAGVSPWSLPAPGGSAPPGRRRPARARILEQVREDSEDAATRPMTNRTEYTMMLAGDVMPRDALIVHATTAMPQFARDNPRRKRRTRLSWSISFCRVRIDLPRAASSVASCSRRSSASSAVSRRWSRSSAGVCQSWIR